MHTSLLLGFLCVCDLDPSWPLLPSSPQLTLPAAVCEALGITSSSRFFFFSHYQAKFSMRMGRFKKLLAR